MAVKTYTQEISSSVAASRMFNAICVDSHNFMPKAFQESAPSIEFVQGDCAAVGSVKLIKYVVGGVSKSLKHKIDELDVDKFYYKYTSTEGNLLGETVESLVVEIKFEATSAGCVAKVTSHIRVKDGAELDEEKVEAGKVRMMKTFKGVEDYLKANPQVYA